MEKTRRKRRSPYNSRLERRPLKGTVTRRIQFEKDNSRGSTDAPVSGTLAIVGRPNVGKSTLFNRLVGSRRAIVGDEPGITRDRLYGEAEWNGRKLRVVDTGGIIPDEKELIPSEIFRQARVALDEAERHRDGGRWPHRAGLARHGIGASAAAHRQAAGAGGQQDGQRRSMEPYAEEFRSLGIKELIPISAENGNGLVELLEYVLQYMPEVETPALRRGRAGTD